MSSLENRLEARKKVNDFFKNKRRRLNTKGPFDFSLENKTKRKFLVEMNSLEKDFEHKAMSLADKGEKVELEGEMNEEFNKLKKSFVSELSVGEPTQDALYKNVVSEISML